MKTQVIFTIEITALKTVLDILKDIITFHIFSKTVYVRNSDFENYILII